MKIQAVAFDMDGLMFDTERMVKEAWERTGLEMGYENMGDMVYKTLGCSETDSERIYYQEMGEDFPYHEFREREKASRKALIARDGLPVKEGLLPLLAYLKEQCYPMVVATSTRTVTATGYLQQMGLLSYFVTVVGGDQVERSKPNPAIYLKASEALGYPPEACLALEDSHNGVRAAFAGGLQCIMVPDLAKPTEETAQKTVATLPSLVQVIDWLEQQK